MGNCEKCGKMIENGAVFCKSCTSEFGERFTQKKDDITEVGIEPELFSYKRKHSTLIARITLGLPIILGFIAIIIGIVFIVPDFGFSEDYLIILPTVIIILGLLITIQLYRHVHQYPLLFLILAIFLLTTGTAITFPEFSSLLLSIGTTISVLMVLMFVSLQYGRKKVLFINLALIVLTFGVTIVIPDYGGQILALGAILIGFFLIIGKL